MQSSSSCKAWAESVKKKHTHTQKLHPETKHVGIFWDWWTKSPPPLPLSPGSIKTMTTKLPGCTASKNASFEVWRRPDDVIWRGNHDTISKRWPSWIRHLGFFHFFKTSKNQQIWPNVRNTNKLQEQENTKFWETACQKWLSWKH